MVGQDDPTTNPFASAVSNLNKQREALVKQKKIEAEKVRAALAAEQQDRAKKRKEQLAEAKNVLVMDAHSAIEQIKPEDYIDSGSISFTSEAFAWFAEDGMDAFRLAPEFLAVASYFGGLVRLYDPMSGALLRIINNANEESEIEEVELEEGSNKVAFSADGGLLACVHDGIGDLWNPSTGEFVRRLWQDEEEIHSLAFSPTDRILATLDFNGNLYLWDIEGGHTEYLETDEKFGTDEDDRFAFSQDGTMIAAGNCFGELRIWDVETGEHQTVVVRDEDPITALAFSTDSKALFVGTGKVLSNVCTKTLEIIGVAEHGGDVKEIYTQIDGRLNVHAKRGGVLCSELDLIVVPSDSKRIVIGYVRPMVEVVSTILAPEPFDDIALSPSPHPGLSTIFTEVKLLLTDVGFTLSTLDGIHFALSWEAES